MNERSMIKHVIRGWWSTLLRVRKDARYRLATRRNAQAGRRVQEWPEKGFIHERILLFQAQHDYRTVAAG